MVDLLSASDGGGERTHAALELAGFLDSVPELAGLGASGRLSLTRDLRSRSVAQGEDIVREGDAADSLFLIRSGTCVVWRGEDGPERSVLAELRTGQPFGEIGLMFRTPRTASVTAKEACELVEVSRAALEKALARSFHVGLALESLAARRMGGAA